MLIVSITWTPSKSLPDLNEISDTQTDKFKEIMTLQFVKISQARGHQLIKMGVRILKSLHFSLILLISEDFTDFKRFL